MSAPAVRGNTRAEPQKGENTAKKHVKFEVNVFVVSSDELAWLNRCCGGGCAELP
jgi:hypothetical protein